MPSAAKIRWRALCALALAAAECAAGADPAPRQAPTRPGAEKSAAAPGPAAPKAPAPPAAPPSSPAAGDRGAVATRKINGLDYVNLADVAARLGLKLALSERGKRAVLAGAGVRAEIEADTRDVEINGLRVFLGDPSADVDGRLYVSRIDYERCLVPLLRPGAGVAARPAPRLVVLDPGHGGNDPGKTNARLGVNEKTVALDVARRTKARLEAAGFRVVLTRDDDTFVALPQRATIANLAKADLFVSIHFNALPNDTKTSGVEVYTFAPRTQRSTNAWGPAEANDAEPQASPVNRFDHWNALLAHALHRRLVVDLKLPDRGKKLMHLGVLRPLAAPSVLVECGFLSSDAEARRIAQPDYRQQLAVALAAGIADYAATLRRVATAAPAASFE